MCKCLFFLHQIAREIKTITKFLIVIDYHQPDLTTNNIHGKITQFRLVKINAVFR